MKKNKFFLQTQLMLEVLPYVMQEEVFALKGGTAINFFFRDMPRFSVDIDLTYLPIESREASLVNIEKALQRVTKVLVENLPDIKVKEGRIKNPNVVSKLYVSNVETQIKVETNLVIRGTVFPVEKKILSPKAQDMFRIFVEGQVVSFVDAYGGKICAALDRQHPRDMYDFKFLLDNEGFTENIRKGFLVYLISHDRPMHELLNPKLKEFKVVYEAEFQGMTNESIAYEELLDVRAKLIHLVQSTLTQDEKNFLISFKKGDPQWSLLGLDHVDQLPAVRWKLFNIQQMDQRKHREYIDHLQRVL